MNGANTSSYVGGILGYCSGSKKTDSDGYVYSNYATLDRCYSTGTLTASAGTTSTEYKGGIIGKANNATYELLIYGQPSVAYAKYAVGGVSARWVDAITMSPMPEMLIVLNQNTAVTSKRNYYYKEDSTRINSGYPILYWE